MSLVNLNGSRRRAVVEPLESRQLRSVSLDASHVLHVDGTAGNDTLWVGVNGSNVEVHVNSNSVKTYPLKSVASVVMRGFDGNDYIGRRNGFPLPMTLDGGNGNDVIVGGVKNDSLIGASGDDNLQGNFGNDSISGGGGADKIFGDQGNDILNGGAGDDYIQGGDGNDKLTGNSGRDVLNGNDGDDYIYSLDGEIDTVAGGNGTDDADTDEFDKTFSLP